MKQRIKLLHCTGRIPAIDLDTGEKLDFISWAGSEIELDMETGEAHVLPDGRSQEEIRTNAKAIDLLDDPLEDLVYQYRWIKVDGAND